LKCKVGIAKVIDQLDPGRQMPRAHSPPVPGANFDPVADLPFDIADLKAQRSRNSHDGIAPACKNRSSYSEVGSHLRGHDGYIATIELLTDEREATGTKVMGSAVSHIFSRDPMVLIMLRFRPWTNRKV
jgi:hypothetical protein